MAGLYDYHWQQRRKSQLRAHPLCRICMEVFQRARVATVADHVVPHRGDPELFEGELQSLCKECHDSIKREIEEKGFFSGCDVNGMPLDPAHPWNRERSR